MQIKITTCAALLALTFFSCNQGELDEARAQRDSVMSVLKEREADLNEREATLNEFVESFDRVERNLDSVAVRQKLIYSATESTKGELKGNRGDKINAQINAINDLMDQNRKTIASLEKKLRRSGGQNKKLEKTIATLRNQLAEKDQELAALNARLQDLDGRLAQLQTAYDSLMAFSGGQSRSLEEMTTALHTAYYMVGRSKDLRAANVIDRKGGLLGIGRTSRLSEGFDRSKFTRIDYTQNTTIPVNSRQVKVITHHPADSYRLERAADDRNLVTDLVIDNPERFWSVSKYLVIQGNPVNKDRTMAAGTPSPTAQH